MLNSSWITFIIQKRAARTSFQISHSLLKKKVIHVCNGMGASMTEFLEWTVFLIFIIVIEFTSNKLIQAGKNNYSNFFAIQSFRDKCCFMVTIQKTYIMSLITLIYTPPLEWWVAYWFIFFFFSSIESCSKRWMETRCSFHNRKDFYSFGRNSGWQSACACWAWYAAVSVCGEILRLVNYITSVSTWVQ